MQKVLLIGYLGRDPEVKYSQYRNGHSAVFRRHHGTIEGQGRCAARTQGVVWYSCISRTLKAPLRLGV